MIFLISPMKAMKGTGEFNQVNLLNLKIYPIAHKSKMTDGHVFLVYSGTKVRIEAVDVVPIPATGILIKPFNHSQFLLQHGFSFSVKISSLFTVRPSREI